MKYKQIILSALLLFGFGLTELHAQESLNTVGDNAIGSGGSMSYSIGQVVYTTNTATSGSVAQGVQQPYEISVITGTIQAKDINLLITAYPNPTINNLILNFNEFKIANLSYQLYNLQGKLLQSDLITSRESSIYMSDLPPATYFVKIIQDNNEVKVFKINKK